MLPGVGCLASSLGRNPWRRGWDWVHLPMTEQRRPWSRGGCGGRGPWMPHPNPMRRPHAGLPTGPRPFQTPPPGPGPGAGSVLSAVKVEDGWAQGPPEPTACELSKRTHGPSAAGSPGDSGGTARVQVPSWGSAARGEAWACLLESSRVGFSAPQQSSASPQGTGHLSVSWVERHSPGRPSQAVNPFP